MTQLVISPESLRIPYTNHPLSSANLLVTSIGLVDRWTSDDVTREIGNPVKDNIIELQQVNPKASFKKIFDAFADPDSGFYEDNQVFPKHIIHRAAGLAEIALHPEKYEDIGRQLAEYASNEATKEDFRECLRLAIISDKALSDKIIAEHERNSFIPRANLAAIAKELNYWQKQSSILAETLTHLLDRPDPSEDSPTLRR